MAFAYLVEPNICFVFQ